MSALRSLLIVGLALIAAAACGPHGFDRPSLTKGLGVQLPPADGDIARALEIKPGARPPLKIAVYLYPEPLAEGGSRSWSWKGRDRDALLAATKRLERDRVVADMFVLSDLVVPGRDLKTLRLAAAQHGADALLLVTGSGDTDAYNNPLSLLYLTVIGYWLVPGTHRDALFLTRGAMWDVRTGYLYLTIETEAKARTLRPGAFSSREAAIDQAKEEALDHFRDDLVRRLRRLTPA